MTRRPRLADALDRYVASVETTARHWSPNLNPGLHRDDVQRRLGRLVADPVDEVTELYSWRDGQAGSPMFGTTTHHLFWTMYFFPLADVEARIGQWREFHEEWRFIGEAEGGFWPTALVDLLPIFFVQDWQACVWVDCGSGPTRGRVFFYGQEGEFEPLDMFESLTDAVDAARFRFETGEWTVDEDAWVGWPPAYQPGENVETPGRL